MIDITNHAKEQMALHGIDDDDVERIIESSEGVVQNKSTIFRNNLPNDGPEVKIISQNVDGHYKVHNVFMIEKKR